jgi:hypothetical protein
MSVGGSARNKPTIHYNKAKFADADPEEVDPSVLPPSVLIAVEADSFWCLSRLLDGIQDNYITAQPGIQRSVKRMAELVARIDAPLSEHLAAQGVEFMQFAFRWMNCLLMREISVRNTVRMWDTYLVRPLRTRAMIDDGWIYVYDRRKARTPFLNFICTCVRRFSSGGATSSVRWTSRCVCLSLAYRVHFSRCLSPKTPRASLCSCSRCRHKIGRTTKSRCSSAKRSCLIRYGTTHRATSRENEIEHLSIYHK